MAPARPEAMRHNGLAITRRVDPNVDPSTPLVVLVHGAMDRAASFGRVMRRLPELETVAYDRRGYAGSRPRANADHTPGDDRGDRSEHHHGRIADHGQDLLDVVHFALDSSPLGSVGRRVVLVGHSLGGTICLWVAANPSNPAVSLGVYESPAPWLDDSYLAVGGGTMDIAAREGNATAAEFFYRMMIGDETFARLRTVDIEERRADGDALVAELESLRDPLQAFDLGMVQLPVVVGNGESSTPTMIKNARLIAEALPTATTVTIASAAHGAHLSRPDAFADYVRACIDAADPAMTTEQDHG